MKNRIYPSVIVAFIALIATRLNAQNTFPSSGSAGIGTITPNTSSLLDVVSTSKGVLIPRMPGPINRSAIMLANGVYSYTLYIEGKMIDTKQMIQLK